MAAMLRAAIFLFVLAAPVAAKAPQVHVSGWARASIPGQDRTAAYLSIHNAAAAGDRLVAVSTPAASKATIHQTRLAGGNVQMRPLPSLEIAPGRAVAMKPGGMHLMLTGLKAPLRAGRQLPLTLRFQRAGVVRTSVPVQPLTFRAADEHRH
ncbi:copper chaperone PCu(A)C [Sphingomonas sp. GCM10030256]|uniref:copper chaperone PCu(A)C n=1 Tax=Sphingomonas sp. GCM10030256 TaxID=3273427 RepID=UPI003606ED57